MGGIVKLFVCFVCIFGNVLGVLGLKTSPGGPGRCLKSFLEAAHFILSNMGLWWAMGTLFIIFFTDLGYICCVCGSPKHIFVSSWGLVLGPRPGPQVGPYIEIKVAGRRWTRWCAGGASGCVWGRGVAPPQIQGSVGRRSPPYKQGRWASGGRQKSTKARAPMREQCPKPACLPGQALAGTKCPVLKTKIMEAENQSATSAFLCFKAC